MSDPKPAVSSLPAALLRHAGAALFHFVFWLVYLNLRWPFDDLSTIYPPERPDGTYFAQMAMTAAIGVLGLAVISLLRRYRQPGGAMRRVCLAFARATLSAVYWIGMMIWLAIPLFGWIGDWAPGTEPDPRPTQGGALLLVAGLIAGWAALLAAWDRKVGR